MTNALKDAHAQTVQKFKDADPEVLIDYSDPDYDIFRPKSTRSTGAYTFLSKITEIYSLTNTERFVAIHLPDYIKEFICVNGRYNFYITVKNPAYNTHIIRDCIDEILAQTRQLPNVSTHTSTNSIPGYTRFVPIEPFTPECTYLYFSECTNVYIEELYSYNPGTCATFYSGYTKDYYTFQGYSVSEFHSRIEEFTEPVFWPCWAENCANDNLSKIYALCIRARKNE